jgi:hypothetical protein
MCTGARTPTLCARVSALCVHSFGIILWEVLTKQVPFAGCSRQVGARVCVQCCNVITCARTTGDRQRETLGAATWRAAWHAGARILHTRRALPRMHTVAVLTSVVSRSRTVRCVRSM